MLNQQAPQEPMREIILNPHFLPGLRMGTSRCLVAVTSSVLGITAAAQRGLCRLHSWSAGNSTASQRLGEVVRWIKKPRQVFPKEHFIQQSGRSGQKGLPVGHGLLLPEAPRSPHVVMFWEPAPGAWRGWPMSGWWTSCEPPLWPRRHREPLCGAGRLMLRRFSAAHLCGFASWLCFSLLDKPDCEATAEASVQMLTRPCLCPPARPGSGYRRACALLSDTAA